MTVWCVFLVMQQTSKQATRTRLMKRGSEEAPVRRRRKTLLVRPSWAAGKRCCAIVSPPRQLPLLMPCRKVVLIAVTSPVGTSYRRVRWDGNRIWSHESYEPRMQVLIYVGRTNSNLKRFQYFRTSVYTKSKNHFPFTFSRNVRDWFTRYSLIHIGAFDHRAFSRNG